MFTSDNEYIGRFLHRNDGDAFESLVRRHAGLVMSVCRSMLRHRQDSEDAFQATFLVLSRKIGKLQNRNSIAGWLYHTAVRNCLALRRRKYSSREDEMASEPIDSSNEPWQTISDRQEIELVHRELNRLPERYRNVILLCHVQGLSREKAAELLDVTEASVKASLARGRKLLRSKLVQRGIAMSVMMSVLFRVSDSFGSEIDEALIESTVQLCGTSLSGSGGGEVSAESSAGNSNIPNEMVSKITEEGVRNMTIYSSAKIASITLLGTIVFVSPFLLLASDNGSSIENNKSTLEIAVDDSGFGGAITASKAPVRVDAQKSGSDKSNTDEIQALNELNEKYWSMQQRGADLRIEALQKRLQTLQDKNSADAISFQADIMELESQKLKSRMKVIEARIAQKSKIPPASTDPIQPGEVLVVDIVDNPDLGRRVTVQRDNTIILPWIGVMSTKGLTSIQLTELIKKEYTVTQKIFNEGAQILVYRASASEPLHKTER